MNLSRRNILKGMVALGSASALALATPLWASAFTRNRSIHLIVANDIVGQSFLTGANTVQATQIQSVLVSETSMQFLQKYQALLNNGKGKQIFGLVDDANAVLIMDLARSANARVLWQKDHIVQSTTSAKQLGLGLVSNDQTTLDSASADRTAFNKHYVSFLIES